MKRLFSLILLLFLIVTAWGQIRLVEVDPINDLISIKNYGGTTIDISGYRLCARFIYTPNLSSLTLESGDLNLAGGATVVVSGFSLNNTSSDLGIYLASGAFGSATAMVDFTQWGAGGIGRESVAVAKGIWTAGDYVDGNPPFQYIGDGNQNGLDFWQATPNSETDFFSFSFGEETNPAVIDHGNHTIEVEVVFGTDLTDLVAFFTLSDGATAIVNATTQTSGVTSNDFTNPITYTVTAEDGITIQDWIVTVVKAPNNEADILSYSFPQETGPGTIGDGTVDIEVAQGTDLTSLAATFTLSENATAEVETVTQVSGITTNDFTNSVIYTVTAQDGFTQKGWIINVVEEMPLNTGTDFTAFGFSEQTGPAVINNVDHSISIEVHHGANITSLTASFTISSGAIAEVNSITQNSGITSNDFSSPITYRITAEDGTTFQDWVITVTRAFNNEADFINYSFSEQSKPAVINPISHTISIEVNPGTDITSLVAIFELSPGATVKINLTPQVSGSTSNDFTSALTYTVTAEDGSTVQDWIVAVIFDPQTDFLSFSFPEKTSDAIINSQIHTILIEVEFGTDLNELVASFELSPGATTEVSGVPQISGVTANNFTQPVTYNVISPGGVSNQNWVITVIALSNETDFLTFSLAEQTGAASIDAVNHTIDIEVIFGTDILSLIASFTISEGATAWIGSSQQISGITENDFTSPIVYNIIAEDGISEQEWVISVTTAFNDKTEILSFSFVHQSGPALINSTENSVFIELISGTVINDLVAFFELSSGAIAEINGVPQTSGLTSNDFSNPVIYTILAEDGITSEDWIINVSVAPNTETDFISFSFPEQVELPIIDTSNHFIDVLVGFGTDLSSLVAFFALSDGAVAIMDGVNQVSGVTVNDFSGPTTYTVVAEDEVTTQDWIVCVSLAPNTETDILGFNFPEQSSFAAIDKLNAIVGIEINAEADITNLVAAFTLSVGAKAEVNGVVQVSRVTSNDYSVSVVFTIIAEDGVTKKDWSINVTQQEITSVNKKLQSNDLSIYPNPVNRQFKIRLENNYIGPVILTIRDGNGKELYLRYFQKSERNFDEYINIEKFQGRILLLEIRFNQSVISRRILQM